VRVFEDAWDRFTPFLAFPPVLRRVIYTTNAIESLNYQLRKVTKNRGHFPSDDAVVKLPWLAICNIEGDVRRMNRTFEHAGVLDVRQDARLGEQLAGPSRFGSALVAQVDIHPPGEEVPLVPVGVSVAQEDEGVRHSSTLPSTPPRITPAILSAGPQEARVSGARISRTRELQELCKVMQEGALGYCTHAHRLDHPGDHR